MVEQYVRSGKDAFRVDGGHTSDQLRLKQVQILNNLLCNDVMMKNDRVIGEDRICRCGI
jgi:hypothetical protein